MPTKSDLIGDFRTALAMLSRLPAGGGAVTPRIAWAFPLVGALLGAIGGLAYVLAAALHLPPWLAAFWALAAEIGVAGGLHEDGLADSADALGAEASPARRLEILRDSRIGVFGALALILALGIRASAIAAIAAMGGAGAVLAAMMVAGASARAAMIGVPFLLAPARRDGLGAGLGRLPAGASLVGVGLAGALALTLLGPGRALGVALIAALALFVVAGLAARRLGGYTGDIYGAVAAVAACCVLSLLAAVG